MPRVVIAPDGQPTARRLHATGSVSVVLFVLTGIIAPMIILNSYYDTALTGLGLIEHIGAQRLWWIALQNRTMGSMVFVIPPLSALCPALKNVDAALDSVGIVLAISCQVLFMTHFPVVNGFTWIADRYAEATDPAYRAALIGGAEAFAAQHNAYAQATGFSPPASGSSPGRCA